MSTLPDRAVVRLVPAARWLDGQTLIGGSPARLFRLTSAARRLFVDDAIAVRDGASAALATRLLRAGVAELDLETVAQPQRSEVTVVIPIRGRAASLRRLLESVPSGCAEVIVVDDGSSPPEAAAIRDVVGDRPGHRVLRLPVNQGPAAARNAGLRAARTRLVLFADSDVVLDAAAVDRLLRHFADPALAVVAPRIAALDGSGESWLARYEQGASALDMGQFSGVVAPRSAVGWVPSACWLAAADLLGDGFDPQMRVAEDVDLCWRLHTAGGVVRYDADAVVRHEHRVGWGAWLERRFHYGTGATALAQRHGDLVAPAVLAPWTAALLLALALQRRGAVPLAAAAWVVGWRGSARRLPGPAGTARRQALSLSARGALSAAEQVPALMLRHGWPLSLALSLGSRRVRRMLVASLIVDGVRARQRADVPLDPCRHLLARRLDDLAYGAGVWTSAWRGRSVRALLPAVVRGRGARPGAAQSDR